MPPISSLLSWIPPLKHATTYFNKVTLHQLLNQITSSSGGPDVTNIVSLIKRMMDFWNADPCVPEYINKMEDSQKKVYCVGLPITDNWLVAIVSSSLLVIGIFPKQRPDWDGLTTTTKEWTLWKSTFCAGQLTIERGQEATNTRSNLFGTENSAAAIHGIDSATKSSLTPSSIAGQNAMLDQLDSHLDNIVMAITNKKEVLTQHVANNAKLTNLTNTQ